MASSSVPKCSKCDDEDDLAIIKPDIVFFGEPLPKIFDDHVERDTAECDLVIVMGSSLKVQPVSIMPDLISPQTPQILINRERLDHNFDIELLGDADTIVSEIARRLGWTRLGERNLGAVSPPTIQQSLDHVHLFNGAKLGLRPEIPDTSADGSLLSEALVGESIDLSKVFPKPPQSPLLDDQGNLVAIDPGS